MFGALKYYKANMFSVHQVATSHLYQLLIKVFKLTENPGKPEVTEFDDLVFGDENIFRLDVSVNALQGQKQSHQATTLTDQ